MIKNINIRVSEEFGKSITERATSLGLTKSGYVRFLLSKELEEKLLG
ncbi:MAG: hypothetical protein ACRCZH_02030 [Cetobacterium sp.]